MNEDEIAGVNVGCRDADVVDAVQGARVPTRLLYPTRAPARPEHFGPYPLAVALGAPVEGDRLPLALISHGTGGSPWVYRDLAAALARAGFVVALPEHPGNTRSDNRLEGTAANLEHRPRHLRLVMDAAFADAALGSHLSPDGVALIGHSMGAYTALAVGGGRPSCFPHESPDGRSHPVAVTPDARVRALVLLAPAAVWYAGEGALDGVDAPVLMWTAEQDVHTPALHGEILERALRDKGRLEHRVVAGAGHFAFLSPFPPAMIRPDFPPSQDPPGFDRAAFQAVLGAGILGFLQRPQ